MEIIIWASFHSCYEAIKSIFWWRFFLHNRKYNIALKYIISKLIKNHCKFGRITQFDISISYKSF